MTEIGMRRKDMLLKIKTNKMKIKQFKASTLSKVYNY